MMKKIFTLAAMSLFALAATAQTPLWLRDAKISPDGQHIAFCYKGDIYKVSVNGGRAQQLTAQDSYEAFPIWSPDGKQIAFTSDRKGGSDIYIMSSEGGSAKRLTSNSASEVPSSFTPDGRLIVFSANIQDPAESAQFPKGSMSEVYTVPVEGGRVHQLLPFPAEMITWSNDGKYIVYQNKKGGEDEWRKHHTSSITRDICIYDFAADKITNLTNIGGEDRNPVLSKDENTIYFLSERNGGSMNVYSMEKANPKNIKALTSFKTHPVRFLSISKDGSMLCYTYNGEIFTQKLGGKPAKVKIELVRDDAEEDVVFNMQGGVSEAVASPDGKQVAMVCRGEILVTNTDYATTKQITHTAAADKWVSWSPDSRTLVYTSERDGIMQLYKATIVRDEEKSFANATLIKEEPILPSKTIERSCPDYSPDGKELAFIQDRNKLMVLNIASGKVRTITDGSMHPGTSGSFGFEWSPDGKWFTLSMVNNMHESYPNIVIVSAKDGEMHDVTRSGYGNYGPTWVMGGNAILFCTERYGMRSHASWGSQNDVMLAFLNQDAYDKYRMSKEEYELTKALEKENAQKAKEAEAKKAEGKKDAKKSDAKKEAEKEENLINIEFDGIEDRIVRLTTHSSDLGSYALDNDGKNLYYFAAFEGGQDLWKMNLRKRNPMVMQKMGEESAGIQMSEDGSSMFIFGSSLSKLDLMSGNMSPIRYTAKVKMNLADEREYMFNRVYVQEKERFYTADMHGVDWEAMCANYRRFLPHINNNYDFEELLSELLGELNVSHTGASYYPYYGPEATASLGLLFSWKYEGKGLKVDEVVKGTPFDNARTKVKAGVIVEKIDGVEILPENSIDELLNGKVKVKTLVSFYDPATKERWEESVLPISKKVLGDCLYNRWVKQRQADVEKWSNGRLGYVHIEGMNDKSFRTIYSDILGKYNEKEGIVIDTRFNGGGRMHEDIEIMFSGKKYFTRKIRGVVSGEMPSRRWNKPSIMIQGEANYSNAHGTPWVYKHCNLGKLVGMPVPGTMTTVSWERLQDQTMVFGIPIVGTYGPDGRVLENQQLEPDILVENDPTVVSKGEDTQLKRAVEELLKELK